MPKRMYPPIHPGEMLKEEFLKPMRISQYRLAKDINVPPRRINEIVLGKRAISADTALRLSRYFGNSAEFWLGLQTHYELDVANDKLGNKLKKEVKIYNIKEIAVTPGLQKKMDAIGKMVSKKI